MNNALGEPQTILLLGGNSDIGLAIVRELLSTTARTVVLACRNLEKGEAAAAGLRHDGLIVDVMHFDGAATETHEAFVADVAGRHGDIDLAIVTLPIVHPTLLVTRLLQDQLVAIFPAAQRDLPDHVTPAWLADQPVIAESRPARLTELMRTWFAAAHVER